MTKKIPSILMMSLMTSQRDVIFGLLYSCLNEIVTFSVIQVVVLTNYLQTSLTYIVCSNTSACLGQRSKSYVTSSKSRSNFKMVITLLISNSIMMLVKFLTSANQKNRIWSCDESRLCNPRPRLLGDEVVVGPSLMFRKMDPWNVIRNILQDKTNKNQL